MHTSITETLNWIDYAEVYRKIEERGENRLKLRYEKVLADKDAVIAENAAIIAGLRAKLDGRGS